MHKLATVICSAVLLACGDGNDPGSLESAARTVPVITSVATTDGFTEICQGCTGQLVIRGDRLMHITRVTLSTPRAFETFTATVVHTSKHEVRANLELRHGATTGLFDVVAGGRDGEATRTDAFTITPFVVAPSAPPNGHATFQSPIGLCDPLPAMGSGDALFLLAGEHVCDHVLHLPSGINVFGEGAALTRVVGTGTGIAFDFDQINLNDNVVFIGFLTIQGAIAAPGMRIRADTFLLNEVDDRGGIRFEGTQLGMLGYRFDGPGTAIALRMTGRATMSDIAIRNCAEGITVEMPPNSEPFSLSFQLEATTIEHCDLGLRIGSSAQPAGPDQRFEPFVKNVQLIDNALAVQIHDGNSIFDEIAIRNDELAPPIASGMHIDNGSLSLAFSEISGITGTGLAFDTSTSAGHGSVSVHNTSITGGEIGVRVHGLDRGTQMDLQNIAVHDQTAAALQLAGTDYFFALGPGSGIPTSTLSVVSGFAIDDQRHPVDPFFGTVGAFNVLLNGTAYIGQLLHGPLELASDIRIVSPDAAWQF